MREQQERYRQLQILKQNEWKEISIVKDMTKKTIYLKRILKDSGALYFKLQDLEHRNLPHIEAVYEQNNKTVVLEQFIAGSNLGSILHEEECLSEVEVRQISIQLCDVLDYLHKRDIIHRDIKPANIILMENGVIKLIDFDIARNVKENQSKDTVYMGTKGYAPPEQYGFAQTDHRADIYALGKTMEELLGPQYHGCLRSVIGHCTELDPAKRYKSVAEVSKALQLCKMPLLYQLFRLFHKGRMVLLAATVCLMIYLVLPNLSIQQQEPDVLPVNNELLTPQDAKQPSAQKINSQTVENPLEFQYVINQSQEEEDGQFYTNGDGRWIFSAGDEPLEDFGISDLYPDIKYITYTIPRSQVKIKLQNIGQSTVINPKIRMVFQGVQLTGRTQEEGITYDGHMHGLGTYTEMIWQPPADTRIPPGDYQEMTLYMDDSAVRENLNPNVEVTVLADDYPAKKFTIPIILEEL